MYTLHPLEEVHCLIVWMCVWLCKIPCEMCGEGWWVAWSICWKLRYPALSRSDPLGDEKSSIGWLYRLVNKKISIETKNNNGAYVMQPLCTNGQMQTVDNSCEGNILRLKMAINEIALPLYLFFCISVFDFFSVVKLFQYSSSEWKCLPSVMFYYWFIIYFLNLFQF